MRTLLSRRTERLRVCRELSRRHTTRTNNGWVVFVKGVIAHLVDVSIAQTINLRATNSRRCEVALIDVTLRPAQDVRVAGVTAAPCYDRSRVPVNSALRGHGLVPDVKVFEPIKNIRPEVVTCASRSGRNLEAALACNSNMVSEAGLHLYARSEPTRTDRT